MPVYIIDNTSSKILCTIVGYEYTNGFMCYYTCLLPI